MITESTVLDDAGHSVGGGVFWLMTWWSCDKGGSGFSVLGESFNGCMFSNGGRATSGGFPNKTFGSNGVSLGELPNDCTVALVICSLSRWVELGCIEGGVDQLSLLGVVSICVGWSFCFSRRLSRSSSNEALQAGPDQPVAQRQVPLTGEHLPWSEQSR